MNEQEYDAWFKSLPPDMQQNVMLGNYAGIQGKAFRPSYINEYTGGSTVPTSQKLSLTQKYNKLGQGTRAGIQMGTSVAGNAIYNLASGNRRTTAGGVMSGLGDAAIASGNPYAMAAGLAAKGLGAFINRGWGNDPEAMLRYNGHINGL